MRKSPPTPFLFAAWLCVACGDEADSLADARARWAAKQPASYVIEQCLTGLTVNHTQIAVADGQVTRAREIYPEPRELDVSEQPEPVAAGFETIDRIHTESDCDNVSTSFDPTYGYPTAYGAYCGTESFDIRVTCFVADTNDLDVCPAAECSAD